MEAEPQPTAQPSPTERPERPDRSSRHKSDRSPREKSSRGLHRGGSRRAPGSDRDDRAGRPVKTLPMERVEPSLTQERNHRSSRRKGKGKSRRGEDSSDETPESSPVEAQPKPANYIPLVEYAKQVEATKESPLPKVAAFYVAHFEHKTGWQICWKKTTKAFANKSDEFWSTVAYKSIPAQAHHLKKDILYFADIDYFAIAIFRQGPDSSVARNSRSTAVGLIFPFQSYLKGDIWAHAAKLNNVASIVVESEREFRSMASQILGDEFDDISISKAVEKKWELGHIPITPVPDRVPELHPIRGLINYVHKFGPLIFPIYREALIRKRILIIGQPELRKLCEYVYIISKLSSLDYIGSESDVFTIPEDGYELRPLFNVGLADLGFTQSTNSEGQQIGWVACTSDEVLITKSNAADVVVHITPDRAFPTLRIDGKEYKATQRDLMRYKMLYNQLKAIEEDPLGRIKLAALPHEKPTRKATAFESTTNYEGWLAFAYRSLWWFTMGQYDSALERSIERDRLMINQLFEVKKKKGRKMAVLSEMVLFEKEGQTCSKSVLLFESFTRDLKRVISKTANIRGKSKAAATDPGDGTTTAMRAGSITAHAYEAPVPGQTKRTRQSAVARAGLALAGVGFGGGYSKLEGEDPPLRLSFDMVREMGLDPWSVDDCDFVAEFIYMWTTVPRTRAILAGGWEWWMRKFTS